MNRRGIITAGVTIGLWSLILIMLKLRKIENVKKYYM